MTSTSTSQSELRDDLRVSAGRSLDTRTPSDQTFPRRCPTKLGSGLSPLWTDSPDVQDVLASIKSNPPRRALWTDWSPSSRGKTSFTSYVGNRVDMLESYRNAYLAAALKQADETGDRSIFTRAAETPSVEDMICAALAEGEN